MLTSREEKIFQVAVEIDSAERQAIYLDQACGNDDGLRERLKLLLQADSQADSFWDRDAVSQEIDQRLPHETETLPEIDGYHLLAKINEGGMGIVYLAEQLGPVRRKVALKLLKTNLTDAQALVRFAAEKQFLASLNHPNIAFVYAAGTTDSGRPYVVMEWIDGIPLTQYCDDHRFSVKERLKLFRQACAGVQHAHNKGIIHRDLKPSNILVCDYDHQPIAKVIDFGVAKAQGWELSQEFPLTRADQIIGTLEYMSPEQARFSEDEVDTRTDVYSLGVILHELLAGVIPLSREFADAESMGYKLDLIRNTVPPAITQGMFKAPDIEEIAARRQTTVNGLGRELNSDLRWIVAKALEKDVRDRYSTVQLFACDLESHLNSRPITARRPSLIRQLALIYQRHPVGATVTFLTLFMAVVLMINSLVAYQGKEARKVRESQLQRAAMDLERSKRIEKARTIVLPRIKELIDDQQPVAAYALKRTFEPMLLSLPEYQDFKEEFSFSATFDQLPTGTTIKIRDAVGESSAWYTLATTPVETVSIPYGLIRVRYENPDYVTRDFQLKVPNAFSHTVVQYLVRREDQKEGMVWISPNHGFRKRREAIDEGFWIDRTEVTNAQYQEFVDAGAYEDPAFWNGISFHRNEQETAGWGIQRTVIQKIEWSEAMASFRDATDNAGPATWKNGRFPPGADDYPVAGISWYEARAYAAFRSKSLPTFHHWRWAASTDQPGMTADESCFMSTGPQPCGQSTGIGRFDACDMAGNVREWCWNADETGNRYILGGSWRDPEYAFSERPSKSPWDRSEINGFRCCLPADDSNLQENLFAVAPQPKSLGLGPDRESFERLRSFYLYDANLPFDPRVVALDSLDGFNSAYRHEIVEINAAYGNERFNLHLLIPRKLDNKTETILFVPGVSAWETGGAFEISRVGYFRYLKGLAGSGRIICLPVFKGTFERWSGSTLGQQFEDAPIQARNDYIAVTMDASRAVDYLLTRDEVDPERLIYFGLSNGALRAPLMLATDHRYRAAILLAGGYVSFHKSRPEIQPFQFTPYVTLPTLMINGTADQVFPLETSQKPMFRDLGSSKKKHVLFLADHLPAVRDVDKTINDWLANEAYQTTEEVSD